MVVAMLLLMFLLTDDGFGADFVSPPATIRVVPGQSTTLALKVYNIYGENINVHVHTNIPNTYSLGELLYLSLCSCSLFCHLMDPISRKKMLSNT